MLFSMEHQCWYFMEQSEWTKEKLVSIFVPTTGGICVTCPNSASKKKKKKGVEKKYLLSVLIQVFSFIQLYYVWFLFSSHKNISNFSNLFFIILFIFRVRVCCVWIPVMVRFIIANIRCYRCRSAGLRVGWFLHWFCEVQLHLIGEQSTI